MTTDKTDKKEGATAAGALQWLEEELRQTKAHLHKLENQLTQAMNQLWGLTDSLRKAEESLGNATAAITLLPHLQEEVRQIKDQLGRLQDRQTAIHNRAEELARQRQADLERERQERGDLAKRVDVVENLTSHYEGRVQALEDASRHLEEEMAGLRQAQETQERSLNDLETRASRNEAAVNRLEDGRSGLNNELQSLHKQEEVIAERVHLYHEQLRRSEQRLDQLEQALQWPRQITEKLERARVEQEELSRRLATLERALAESSDKSQDYSRSIDLLEQRIQTQTARLTTLADEVREHRQQVSGYLKGLAQLQERQKRRHLEALEQEIKELKQSELRRQAQ